jgi:hypothetical protein
VDFSLVDILTDHAGLEQLLTLGVRKVPVVTNGERFVFAQNLDALAEFVGVRATGHRLLPPDTLIEKWINVLRAAQRYVRQIPVERMNERALASRDRTVRILSHHVFRIAEAFLESVSDGVEYSTGITDVEPSPGECRTGPEIAHYGDAAIERLQAWWKKNPDHACRRLVQTYYGPQSIHELLERSTWHSAQHARQLTSLLERYGIDPDRRLVEEDLAGLPLPQGVFD